MLEKLRKAMKAADIDMLLIPSADPHGSFGVPGGILQGTQALFGLYGQRRNSAHMAGGRRALDRRTVFHSGSEAA